MRNCLLLDGGVHNDPLEIFGLDRSSSMGHREALLQQRGDLLLTQPLAPAGQRRAIERQVMPEHHLATEILEIRVLDPPVAQRLVREIVHVLEDKQSGYQSCRQGWLPRPEATDRTEASRQEVPIDLRRQTHQRMAKVDDLLQRWTKQIVLTIVARTAHGFSPTANLAVKGITKPPNPEFKNARKPGPTHGFLAKSNTCSRQITPADQSLPNSSRATSSSADGLMSFAGALLILRAQAKRRLNALGTARICNLGTGFMTRRD